MFRTQHDRGFLRKHISNQVVWHHFEFGAVLYYVAAKQLGSTCSSSAPKAPSWKRRATADVVETTFVQLAMSNNVPSTDMGVLLRPSGVRCPYLPAKPQDTWWKISRL